MEIVPGKTPTLTVLVNCSGQKLNELPPSLPPNTRALNVSNNNVSLEHIYIYIQCVYLIPSPT